jgi:hypothetical protein
MAYDGEAEQRRIEALEKKAEERAERRRDGAVERPDRWGRCPDWHVPRGWGQWERGQL